MCFRTEPNPGFKQVGPIVHVPVTSQLVKRSPLDFCTILIYVVQFNVFSCLQGQEGGSYFTCSFDTDECGQYLRKVPVGEYCEMNNYDVVSKTVREIVHTFIIICRIICLD